MFGSMLQTLFSLPDLVDRVRFDDHLRLSKEEFAFLIGDDVDVSDHLAVMSNGTSPAARKSADSKYEIRDSIGRKPFAS